MPPRFSTQGRRARRPCQRDVRPRVDRVGLNDLFALFPPLPGFRHRRVADQLRRVRENAERMQRRARASVNKNRAAAARVKAAWLAKRPRPWRVPRTWRAVARGERCVGDVLRTVLVRRIRLQRTVNDWPWRPPCADRF